ncbi:MAG: hypothetical protein ACRDY7_15145 [Acidimicrobiia bacterium]
MLPIRIVSAVTPTSEAKFGLSFALSGAGTASTGTTPPLGSGTGAGAGAGAAPAFGFGFGACAPCFCAGPAGESPCARAGDFGAFAAFFPEAPFGAGAADFAP